MRNAVALMDLLTLYIPGISGAFRACPLADVVCSSYEPVLVLSIREDPGPCPFQRYTHPSHTTTPVADTDQPIYSSTMSALYKAWYGR